MRRSKKKIILIAVLISLALVLFFSARWIMAKPILKVITLKQDEEQVRYSLICNGGIEKKTEEFDPDQVTIYKAADGDIESQISGGKVYNIAKKAKLIDSDNNTVDAHGNLLDLLQRAADDIDHAISELSIIVDGDNYYCFVKLNVNWQDPCILYRFDPKSNELIRLYEWNGVDIIGISENIK